MRRKDERGVSPVIATILMVAITVVLAAVLYVMVAYFIQPTDVKPIVSLSSGECGPTWCEGTVAGTNANHDLSRYKVTVLANGEPAIAATVLEAGTNLTGGGLTFRYTDLGGDQVLNAGDTFRLSGLQAGVQYRIALLWQDGSELRSIVFAR